MKNVTWNEMSEDGSLFVLDCSELDLVSGGNLWDDIKRKARQAAAFAKRHTSNVNCSIGFPSGISCSADIN